MTLRYIVLVLSLVAVGASLWLSVVDIRVAWSDGVWMRLNWLGRAVARTGAAIIVVEIAKLVYRALELGWNADTVAYTVGLLGYTVGTILSLFAMHPTERAHMSGI